MEAEKYTIDQVETALAGYKEAGSAEEKEHHLNCLLLYLTPLICKKVRHYFGITDEEGRRDLVHDGYIRAIELIDAFDRERGIRFLGYMKRMLGCFYFDKRKAAAKFENRCSFQEDYMEPQEDVRLCNVEIRDLFRVLSEKEERLIIENVLGGKKLIRVSEEMGISYIYAKEVKRKALRKLRKYLSA